MSSTDDQVMPDLQYASVAIGDGCTFGMANGDIQLYGRGGNVGAVITAETLCSRCGKAFEAGHHITADLAPNMAGISHHTDCDDPKLERTDGE